MSILFKVVGAERLLKCNVDKLAVHLKEIKYCHPFYALLLLLVFFSQVSEGRPRMSDVTTLSGISGLSFDSPFLSPPWFSAWSSCSLCLVIFLLSVLLSFFPEKICIFNYFKFNEDKGFFVWLLLSSLGTVGGVWSWLLCGTGSRYYVF